LNARSSASFVALAAALGTVPLLHCAQASDKVTAESLDSGIGAAPDAGDEGGGFTGGPTPIPDDVECAETTKQIYVLATDRALYRFYPDKLDFVRVGQVACPTTAGTFSMAIDRHGTAWVEYTDGRLFAVDTTTGACKPTGFRPGQVGFETFGMGYALNGTPDPDAGADGGAEGGVDGGADGGADGGGPKGETLYVSGAGLAALDTKTFELEFLGSLTYGRTELTGQGKQLFAFSVGSGVIAGLNKANGSTELTYRTTAVADRAAFAFAQWGGDFWVFTGDTHSMVTQYSPADDKSAVVVQNTGMLIVGAGSSTCAPSTKAPH
jgi:hypothetical protein